MTTPAKAAQAAAPKGSLVWVQGMVCGALLAFATPTALMLGVLLAPALACFAGERTQAGTMTRGVALCCGAASIGPVWHLWHGGNRMGTALELLSDPLCLVLAWGAGACAWALCQVLPVVMRTTWEMRVAARAKAIAAELAACREEWDLPAE